MMHEIMCVSDVWILWVLKWIIFGDVEDSECVVLLHILLLGSNLLKFSLNSETE